MMLALYIYAIASGLTCVYIVLGSMWRSRKDT